ncbi:unnamed protein product [Toxocara canis]|uniref:Uncharacterized protein n=1 Tax=Toxocara canis TaxID=6265 RepID=A0A183TYE9_TOXCA|nr:unnamed protein product [Toxocara canis]
MQLTDGSRCVVEARKLPQVTEPFLQANHGKRPADSEADKPTAASSNYLLRCSGSTDWIQLHAQSRPTRRSTSGIRPHSLRLTSWAINRWLWPCTSSLQPQIATTHGFRSGWQHAIQGGRPLILECTCNQYTRRFVGRRQACTSVVQCLNSTSS